MKTLNLTLRLFVIIAILFSGFLMVRITLPYFSFRYDVDFLLTKQNALYLDIWRLSFYIHISTSLIVLLVGLFQFIKPIQVNYPVFHRLAGKIYVLLILLLSAPSGFVMALYANGGFWAKCSFTIISVLWWVFTYVAYAKIIKRKTQAHIAYMVRSYALTLSAISLRTYVVVLPHFIHLHSKEMYVTVAWLSWIPNLLIAELLIRQRVFK